MAEKGFGAKEINLIGSSGTPTIESPGNLNLNANNVAISTNVSIGGTLTVSGNISVGGTLTYEDVTNIDSVGIVTAREGIFIPDNKELKIGNTAGSPDFSIKHDTSNTILDGNTGDIIIRADGDDLKLLAEDDIVLRDNDDSTNFIHCINGGKVILYHAGNQKFETNNTGAEVTGTLAATAVTGDGSGLTGIAVTEAPVVDYTITGDGSNYYFHGGGVDGSAGDPDLYLIRGQKYRFNNTTGTGHPFRFTSTGNANAAYSKGVTGSESGVQFWTIPYDAPAKLFYVCTIHGGMVGNIYIRGANGQNDNVGLTTFKDNVSIVKSVPILELSTNTAGNDASIRLHESTPGSTSNGGGMFYSGSDNKLHITCGTTLTTKRVTILRDDGKVGINEESPDSLLHLTTNDSTAYSTSTTNTVNSTNTLLRLENTNGSDGSGVNNYVGMYFRVGSGANSDAQLQYVRTGDNQGAFQFKARNAGSTYPNLMTIKSNGDLTLQQSSTVMSPGATVNIISDKNAETDLDDKANYHLVLANPNNDTNESIGLAFGITDTTTKVGAAILHERDAAGSQGSLRFFTRPNNAGPPTEKVRIPATTWGLLVTNQSSTGSTGGYQTDGVSLRYSGDSTMVYSGGPPLTLTRKSNAGKVLDFYNGTTYAGGIYVNGNNQTAIQQGSDYRLKTDITSMTDGINKVKQLNPIYYRSKEGFDTTTVQNGFLAHEVQSVLPTLVDGEKDAPIDEKGKGYQTLNYAGFTPTAIAAIKELIAKVETLEAKVAALESS